MLRYLIEIRVKSVGRQTIVYYVLQNSYSSGDAANLAHDNFIRESGRTGVDTVRVLAMMGRADQQTDFKIGTV
jgi:hypothetical protein